MSYLWAKTEKWKKWCNSENCPVCNALPQDDDFVTIAETNVSWIEAHPRASLKGTCYVMSKKHAVELFDLSDDEVLAFMKDVMVTAKALKEITGAAKINYEIHGNTVPHLHLHLFPRYLEGDRFNDGPINPREIEPPAYDGHEFSKFVHLMRERLSTTLA
ncbi:MAG: HIT family protein [Promethearchaeota archaeon]